MRKTEFRDWLKDQGRADNTIRCFLSLFSKFERYLRSERGAALFTISPGSQTLWVNDYKNYLIQQGRKENTVNFALKALDAYFEFLGHGGHSVPQMPDKRFKPVALPEKDRIRLLKYLDNCTSPRDRAALYVVLYAGLSVSELAALNIQDLTFVKSGGYIEIWGQRLKPRIIRFGMQLKTALKAHLIKQAADGYVLSKDCQPDCYSDCQLHSPRPLWINKHGERLSVVAFQELCLEISQILDLPVSMRTIRNTFVAGQAKRRIKPERLARITGLKRRQTLLGYKKPRSA